jgi:hypothetical protein
MEADVWFYNNKEEQFGVGVIGCYYEDIGFNNIAQGMILCIAKTTAYPPTSTHNTLPTASLFVLRFFLTCPRAEFRF